MKIFVNLIGTMIIAGFVSVACIGSYKSHDYSMEFKPHTFSEEVIIFYPDETEIQPMSEVPLARTNQFVNLTFEEQDMLEEIAMAEARGEGTVGMALIMRTVLNRSYRNNQSIRKVIYSPNQFYTAGMMDGSEDCHEALAMIMDGWNESQIEGEWDHSKKILWFSAGEYPAYGEPLFKYGNHYFSGL